MKLEAQEKQIRDYTALMLLALGLFFYAVLFILWNFSPEEPLSIVPAEETPAKAEKLQSSNPAETYQIQALNN